MRSAEVVDIDYDFRFMDDKILSSFRSPRTYVSEINAVNLGDASQNIEFAEEPPMACARLLPDPDSTRR